MGSGTRERRYLAVDLGAESGRVVLATLLHGDDPDGARMALEEIHRFPNGPVERHGSLRWDVAALHDGIRDGLRAASRLRLPIAGVSVDAWGVDYVPFRAGAPLPDLPFHYRDARTASAPAEVFMRVPREEIYAATGIQHMPLNTLFQLHADRRDRPAFLEGVDGLLGIGDWFNHLLSGVARGEATWASTTQLFDPRPGPGGRGTWAWRLVERLGLPARLLPELVSPGTVLGPLKPALAAEYGLAGAQVVAGCSHDTAAAVAAVPAEDGAEDWAFLSSGTWSLLGVEQAEPRMDAAARAANFTNEAGYAGTVMFRRNLAGLWILQECRRAWAAGGRGPDHAALVALAGAEPPAQSLIRPDDPRFAAVGGMPERVAAYCRETGQAVPEGPGAVARCVLESLALLYAAALADAASLSGRALRRLHVVGGGSRNALLNRLAAERAGVEVVAGPAEATALGNALVQARALGHLAGSVRAAARRSAGLETVRPAADDPRVRAEALARFLALPVSA